MIAKTIFSKATGRAWRPNSTPPGLGEKALEEVAAEASAALGRAAAEVRAALSAEEA